MPVLYTFTCLIQNFFNVWRMNALRTISDSIIQIGIPGNEIFTDVILPFPFILFPCAKYPGIVFYILTKNRSLPIFTLHKWIQGMYKQLYPL